MRFILLPVGGASENSMYGVNNHFVRFPKTEFIFLKVSL